MNRDDDIEASPGHDRTPQELQAAADDEDFALRALDIPAKPSAIQAT